VVPQFVEEVHKPNESAEEFVTRLAWQKAENGLSRQTNQQIPALGSDTAVVLGKKILGKPENREQAIKTLLSLSSRKHQVITAVALANNKKTEVTISMSEVTFSKLDKEMCVNYWQTGEPADKAGSYGIQGRGALFIKTINGSYSGVMGLPIYETSILLRKFGIKTL